MKYFILTVLVMMATSAHAQVVVIDMDELASQRVLTNENWRFHPGDSLSWADPDYDDSTWDRSESVLYLSDSLYAAAWEGMGWFRLKFLVADTTAGHFLLNIDGYGVAELYLNGERVVSTGHIPVLESEEVDARKILESALFEVRGDSVYTLAIRYANRKPPRLIETLFRNAEKTTSLTLASGLRVVIGSPEEQSALIASNLPDLLLFGLLTGLFSLAAILGALLYILGLRDRVLLYLTLALVQLSVLFGLPMYLGLVPSLAWNVPIIVVLLPVFANASFLFLTLGLSLSFFPQLRNLRHVVVVLFILSLADTFIQGIKPLSWAEFGIFGIIVGVIGCALWKKKPGAWALGSGILLFCVIVLVSLFLDLMGVIPIESNYIPVFAISLIPISIGSLIMTRYTESARSLKAQLIEVERLSDEKLAVEQDRQRLIETQKERLEVEVQDRTLELRQSMEQLKETQIQLIQQEKLASLGSLTAGIAHEIKNPLNFVNNFAEVGGELTEELSEAIAAGRTDEAQSILDELRANSAQITKHGRRADDIVKAMMQHARGGASVRESVMVNDFLEEYANLAWHGRRAKDDGFQAELKRDFSNEVGSLDVMPQELGRVVLNLLNNAFDAVRTVNGAEVTLSTRKPLEHIEIRVSDNGPGIPDDIREKIFEPFFTTKATGEGTGLGLSLSYDIVTKGHGGTMTATNRPEGGAEFVVTLDASPNRNSI